MRFWAECSAFFGEFRRTFQTTGSVLPSSRFLARAMTAQLKRPRPSCRVLEVGPGTGAVTCAIARQLGPEDRLDAVEVNARFVQVLQERIRSERAFHACRDRVQVIHAKLEELPGAGNYDFIISGLPLNNFPVEQIRTIFAAYDRLLKPGGTLTYFEYALIRSLKTPFVSREERTRLQAVGQLVGSYIRSYEVRRQQVLANVPPATVRHLCFKPASTH